MKFEKCNLVSCLLVLGLLVVAGCGKKPDEGTPQSPTPAATAPQGQTQAPAMSVDVEKPVAEVRTQAKTMSVDDLKAVALKYKEAIAAKQVELEKLAAKVKEIPITETLGQEAKTLKTELQNIETSLKALKDRFQVYYDTLKEKGGDLSGLGQ